MIDNQEINRNFIIDSGLKFSLNSKSEAKYLYVLICLFINLDLQE